MLVVERMVAGTDDGTTWADDANAAAALACTNTRRQNDNLISEGEVENRAGQIILVMSLELAKSGTPLGAWSHATCNRALLNLSPAPGEYVRLNVRSSERKVRTHAANPFERCHPASLRVLVPHESMPWRVATTCSHDTRCKKEAQV